jgi:general nucleoside transport system ATP-binding protein
VSNTAPALALEHVSKRFGSLQALDDATLTVRPGTVHALLGENGAGKTTLMRIAYGMESPERGSVRIQGRALRLRSPADAIGAGVGMVHQHFTLVPAMTVAENVALGGRGRFDPRRAAAHVRDLGQATGLSLEPDAYVRDLAVRGQQRVELLKVLSRDARVLIFDEPTAVLAPAEAEDLLRQLRRLADDGRAIILITHKLREALSVADDVTVLRRGRTTLAKPRADIDGDQLVQAMLGQRDAGTLTPESGRNTAGATTVRARDVEIADAKGITRVRGATFAIQSGEIVGVAAVEGSGHRELLRAIAGRVSVAAGSLVLPRDIGFVPDDRHRDALVLEMSLAENFALNGAGTRRGLIPWRDIATATRDIIQEFDVRAGDEAVAARTLSGGNQQKFILGRELHGPPALLVIENPTRGLDVRASAFVRDRLIRAAADGVAVVVHSADLDEIMGLAHRVLVVYGGTVREVPVDADLIGRAMLGAE